MNVAKEISCNVPLKNKTLILCDFDGTVSVKDTVNRLVRSHILGSDWRFHVKRYMRGEIGSRAVYESVGPMMRMDHSDLENFVREHAQLDPYFPDFLRWARTREIDVKIVSDGFDATIKTLLDNHGIDGVEIYSNRLVLESNRRVRLESPHWDPSCGECGTCKLKILNTFRSQYTKILLIGDGESDRHAAQHADMVIALKDLFLYCARNDIPAMRVDGFEEIPRLLSRRVEAAVFDMDGTLTDSIDSIAETFNHMFAQLGYPQMTRDEVVRNTSISLMDFLQSYVKPEEFERSLDVFREYYHSIYLDKTTPIPGALETLEALNGTMLLGIITNKRGFYARKIAEHMGFSHHFHRIIGALDGFKAKPSGEMIEEFMRSAKAARDRTIYVGDTPLDVEAAHNAGIDAYVIANTTYSAEELALTEPRRVLKDIAEVHQAFQPVV